MTDNIISTDERIITDLGMFGEAEELVLLANWSTGKHREDISEIDSDIFSRKKLYKAVCEGLNPSEILRVGALEGTSVTELMRIAGATYFEPYYFNDTEAPVYAEARTRALVKQISLYTDKLRNNNRADTDELFEKIRRTEAVISGEEFKPLATNYADTFLKELEEVQEESNPRYGDGFKWLDAFTSGLHRGQLTVIGGRPSNGKSALALQIAYNVAVRQGYKTIFLPLEMSVNECIERLILQTQLLEPNFKKNCSEEDKQEIREFCDLIERDLKFCEALNKLEDIERLIKAEKPYLIVIDQLSQIRGSKKKDIRESYIEITRNLKRIALEQNVAIILLSQLNRLSTDGRKPKLENLAESDSIGQDADNCFLLYRDEEIRKNGEEPRDTDLELDEEDKPKVINLRIVKQRGGERNREIPLMFEGWRYTFRPIDYTIRD